MFYHCPILWPSPGLTGHRSCWKRVQTAVHIWQAWKDLLNHCTVWQFVITQSILFWYLFSLVTTHLFLGHLYNINHFIILQTSNLLKGKVIKHESDWSKNHFFLFLQFKIMLSFLDSYFLCLPNIKSTDILSSESENISFNLHLAIQICFMF